MSVLRTYEGRLTATIKHAFTTLNSDLRIMSGTQARRRKNVFARKHASMRQTRQASPWAKQA
jgi:hypothetical protein